MLAYIRVDLLVKHGEGRSVGLRLGRPVAIRVSAPSQLFPVCVPPQVFHVQNQTMSWGGKVAHFQAGLHLVTLNERTGEVMRVKTFLTWQPEASRQVGQALRDAGKGRLLVIVGVVSWVKPR